MKHLTSHFSWKTKSATRWEIYMSDSVLVMGGVALITTIIAATRLYSMTPTVAFIYFPLISFLASIRGLYAAVLASILAVLSFDFFIFPPSYHFVVSGTADALTLGMFRGTAILIGQFPSILQRRMEQAKNRERELRLLSMQSQEIALLQERQRLARELHDSLAQTLYCIGLEGSLGHKVLDRNPSQAKDALESILALTEAGLAELRALLFELRPESLEREGLVAVLHKQLILLRTRYHLAVEETLEEEPAMPLQTKHALYRIAQEALHNIVKHACASVVTLQLITQAQAIILNIADNGKGFDVSKDFPGHLGLHSMRERVAQMGGTLMIESKPDQGTLLRVQIPLSSVE